MSIDKKFFNVKTFNFVFQLLTNIGECVLNEKLHPTFQSKIICEDMMFTKKEILMAVLTSSLPLLYLGGVTSFSALKQGAITNDIVSEWNTFGLIFLAFSAFSIFVGFLNSMVAKWLCKKFIEKPLMTITMPVFSFLSLASVGFSYLYYQMLRETFFSNIPLQVILILIWLLFFSFEFYKKDEKRKGPKKKLLTSVLGGFVLIGLCSFIYIFGIMVIVSVIEFAPYVRLV